MHKTAYINAQRFYEKYCKESISQKRVIDIGSWDGGNGSLRYIFKDAQYIGFDMQNGPNVDVVGDAHNISFDNNTFDIAVSSSCFEHDPMFWVSFLEICRIIKSSGLIYICAPSAGPYHPEKCPGDSWRFYPDSWKSLCLWAKYNQYNIDLIETYIDNTHSPPDENWQDSIGIFRKIS